MNTKTATKYSKFLSLVLRHKPDVVGIKLDRNGWADVDELLRRCSAVGRSMTRQDLDYIVETNNKKRFSYSEDGKRIRANQGHSVDIQLGLESREPPCYLWHGTATRFLDSIFRDGLQKRQRQHVHLSADRETASKVGQRHGKLALLRIPALKMHQDGHEFFLSDNGVWLTCSVPPQYLEIIS